MATVIIWGLGLADRWSAVVGLAASFGILGWVLFHFLIMTPARIWERNEDGTRRTRENLGAISGLRGLESGQTLWDWAVQRRHELAAGMGVGPGNERILAELQMYGLVEFSYREYPDSPPFRGSSAKVAHLTAEGGLALRSPIEGREKLGLIPLETLQRRNGPGPWRVRPKRSDQAPSPGERMS